MSTFNTRKDRDRNGKAKPHKHSGIPTLTGVSASDIRR